MISYPRWKISLVAVVLLLGSSWPSQSVRRGERGCSWRAIGPRWSIRIARRSNKSSRTRALRRAVRFSIRTPDAARQQQAGPLKGDLIGEARPNQYTIALVAGSRVPEWMRNLGLSPLKLGLDLRGGVYLVYQVDVQAGEAAARPA